MKKNLFCVTCTVDDGCTWKRYNTYVFAYFESQAKLAVKQYWNGQYDTTATIESAKIVDDCIGNIVCMREIRLENGMNNKKYKYTDELKVRCRRDL